MKKRKITIIVVAVLVVTVGLGVFFSVTSSGNRENNPESAASGKKTVSKTVCYAYNYDSLEEMTYVAHFIALARVDSAALTENRSDFAETAFSMTVIEPVYNSRKDETFIIKMEGGETLTTVYKVEGEPLMETGQEVLVFCKMNDDGTYSVINGPQGRLLFENGRLNPLTSENTDGITDGTYSPLPVKNANLIDTIEEIRKYLAVSPIERMDLDYNCKVIVEGICNDETAPAPELAKAEKKKLVDYINNAQISGSGDQKYRDYNGTRYVMFRIIKSNGEQFNVSSASPYLIIDGKGYECDKETLKDIYNIFYDYLKENTDTKHIC